MRQAEQLGKEARGADDDYASERLSEKGELCRELLYGDAIEAGV